MRYTNEKYKTIHNRDYNSSRNMIKITRSIMEGKGKSIEYIKKTS